MEISRKTGELECSSRYGRRLFIKKTLLGVFAAFLAGTVPVKVAQGFIWGLFFRIGARTAARYLLRKGARKALRSAGRAALKRAGRNALRSGASRTFRSSLLRGAASLAAVLSPDMIALAEKYNPSALWGQRGTPNEIDVSFSNNTADYISSERLFLSITDMEGGLLEEEKELGIIKARPWAEGNITFVVSELPNPGIKQIKVFSRNMTSNLETVLVNHETNPVESRSTVR